MRPEIDYEDYSTEALLAEQIKLRNTISEMFDRHSQEQLVSIVKKQYQFNHREVTIMAGLGRALILSEIIQKELEYRRDQQEYACGLCHFTLQEAQLDKMNIKKCPCCRKTNIADWQKVSHDETRKKD